MLGLVRVSTADLHPHQVRSGLGVRTARRNGVWVTAINTPDRSVRLVWAPSCCECWSQWGGRPLVLQVGAGLRAGADARLVHGGDSRTTLVLATLTAGSGKGTDRQLWYGLVT